MPAEPSALDETVLKTFQLSACVALAALAPLFGAAPERPSDPAHAFARVWQPRDGLGPAFNARSCAACHGDVPSPLVIVSSAVTDPSGGHVFARFRIAPSGAIEERARPPGASLRRAPALAGIGLLERVSGRAIAEWADPDDADRNGISGRVPDGRFGWKGRMPDVTTAVAAAFVNELGLSSPFFREPGTPEGTMPELTRDDVESAAEYVRTLPAPVPERDRNHDAAFATFQRIGCAACHRPSLSAPEAKRAIEVDAYTDLLLHDMGPALADGIAEARAGGNEFRTPPLWGLSRNRGGLLHDARAATIEAAVSAHGGEAERSARAFDALKAAEREALLAFLASR